MSNGLWEREKRHTRTAVMALCAVHDVWSGPRPSPACMPQRAAGRFMIRPSQKTCVDGAPCCVHVSQGIHSTDGWWLGGLLNDCDTAGRSQPEGSPWGLAARPGVSCPSCMYVYVYVYLPWTLGPVCKEDESSRVELGSTVASEACRLKPSPSRGNDRAVRGAVVATLEKPAALSPQVHPYPSMSPLREPGIRYPSPPW